MAESALTRLIVLRAGMAARAHPAMMEFVIVPQAVQEVRRMCAEMQCVMRQNYAPVRPTAAPHSKSTDVFLHLVPMQALAPL